MSTGTAIDRLAMRARPDGEPVMRQNWENLLFLHWPIDPAVIRPLIPTPLEIDTFDGKAWIGVTPFSMSDVRIASMPAIPGLDSFLELNVRTYVHHNGKPGVWFFSLDASKLIPALAARVIYMLPYFRATMDFRAVRDEFQFESRRSMGSPASFSARWKTGLRLRDPDAESLAFFLVERYALFAGTGDNLAMTRIYHHPWILDEAVVQEYHSTMISALGMPEPSGIPLAHFSRFLNVEIWEPIAV